MRVESAKALRDALVLTRGMRTLRAAGLTGDRTALVTTRPFRAPRHSISNVGLIGSSQVSMPGEVPRAYYGILLPGKRPEC
jgi:predicted ATPase with chaperone activity